MVSQYQLFNLFNELGGINNIFRKEKNKYVEINSSWWSDSDSSKKDAGMEAFQVWVYGTGFKIAQWCKRTRGDWIIVLEKPMYVLASLELKQMKPK